MFERKSTQVGYSPWLVLTLQTSSLVVTRIKSKKRYNRRLWFPKSWSISEGQGGRVDTVEVCKGFKAETWYSERESRKSEDSRHLCKTQNVENKTLSIILKTKRSTWNYVSDTSWTSPLQPLSLSRKEVHVFTFSVEWWTSWQLYVPVSVTNGLPGLHSMLLSL